MRRTIRLMWVRRIVISGRRWFGDSVGADSLSHLDAHGRASMVDVSAKQESVRTARASARVVLGADVLRELTRHAHPRPEDADRLVSKAKGDVFTVAQIAGIQAAKQTHALIPLCHAVPIDQVALDFELLHDECAVRISSKVVTGSAKTGVEMEALTAVSVAALTVYDMCKAVNKGIRIEAIRLEEKSGGRTGVYTALEEN
ncbi:Cyclic pyranopterin monophosphate synthase [Porphyridium purpureum]|uniref:cyclic pyranopterin monophosphate synthase n=1 Tax=Porphyridium purpureum TaxID=35688 RepID=A0A5J4Z6L0_PORPP|nr:Cyclic pyranopterin monophosphate synthase [Porphyridium purpureum]|eukprot:POR2084..scf295_1